MTAMVNSMSVRTIHGSSNNMMAMTARALGTKASVCSWIVVTAWNKLMARPMTIAVKRIGAAMVSAWMIIVFSKSMANSGFIFFQPPVKTDRQGFDSGTGPGTFWLG